MGRDLLLENLGWIVGDGCSIDVWNDPWLTLTRQMRPMGPPNEAHLNLTVSDLLIPAIKEWDILKIRRILPDFEDEIMCIKPSLTGAPDKLVWLGTKTGEYTTKSGYFTAVNRDETPNPDGFKWKNGIWNLECAPKVKLFAWKLLNKALPVGERLMEQHVSVDPLCKRCGCTESITHLLFQCRFAQRVWQIAPLMSDLDLSGIIDLNSSWDMICKLKCLPPAGLTSGTLVPWVLWLLWKERNKYVFEGHSASPEDTLTYAIKLAREWNTEVKKETITRPKQPPSPLQIPPDALVMRSDAAWSSVTNDAGLGWVILSNSGNRSFQLPRKHVATPLAAEGLALREAVRTCANMELTKVSFESDSVQLIKAVKNEATVTELYSVVADINSYVSTFEFVSFSWIPRERNVLADALAKDALIVSGTMVVGDVFIAPT